MLITEQKSYLRHVTTMKNKKKIRHYCNQTQTFYLYQITMVKAIVQMIFIPCFNLKFKKKGNKILFGI